MRIITPKYFQNGLVDKITIQTGILSEHFCNLSGLDRQVILKSVPIFLHNN